MKTQSIAPVFHVADLNATLDHYTAVLGFQEDFRTAGYVGVKLGAAHLHFALPGDFKRPVGGGTAYIFCDDVDEYFAAIKARGANVKSEPANSRYGMRDFVVCDPDGNHLSFGADRE
jgi:catechol 2,3-dioxygenase-like lactoylglutathione lyase family enzyme